MFTPSVNATLLVSIYAPQRPQEEAFTQNTSVQANVPVVAAATEDTVTLSAKAQALLAQQEATTPKAAPPPPKPDYDIEANLDITTPRPSEESVLSKMSFGGSFLSIRKLTYEEYSALQEKYANAMSSEYQKARYLERHPSPINEVLDRSYDFIEKIMDGKAPKDEDRFALRVYNLYVRHEQYDLHDYAKEVIYKRSLQEYGVGIDLDDLYQEYLTREVHGKKLPFAT
ncbi:MAG: hypothetical protein H6908_02715 [Hyphomicrobiales bacterium]|nr:hypothetical protein [Hyphomicrobiales bacterium]